MLPGYSDALLRIDSEDECIALEDGMHACSGAMNVLDLNAYACVGRHKCQSCKHCRIHHQVLILVKFNSHVL